MRSVVQEAWPSRVPRCASEPRLAWSGDIFDCTQQGSPPASLSSLSRLSARSKSPQEQFFAPRVARAAQSRSSSQTLLRSSRSEASLAQAQAQALQRQLDALEDRLGRRLARQQQQLGRQVTEALQVLENRVTVAETPLPGFGRRLAETSGQIRGIVEEVQSQVMRLDGFDTRLRDWRQELDQEVHQSLAGLRADCEALAAGVPRSDVAAPDAAALRRCELQCSDAARQQAQFLAESSERLLALNRRLEDTEQQLLELQDQIGGSSSGWPVATQRLPKLALEYPRSGAPESTCGSETTLGASTGTATSGAEASDALDTFRRQLEEIVPHVREQRSETERHRRVVCCELLPRMGQISDELGELRHSAVAAEDRISRLEAKISKPHSGRSPTPHMEVSSPLAAAFGTAQRSGHNSAASPGAGQYSLLGGSLSSLPAM